MSHVKQYCIEDEEEEKIKFQQISRLNRVRERVRETILLWMNKRKFP